MLVDIVATEGDSVVFERLWSVFLEHFGKKKKTTKKTINYFGCKVKVTPTYQTLLSAQPKKNKIKYVTFKNIWE